MAKKVLFVLAQGYEESEAICPMDILARCGADVVIAGLDGQKYVTSASGNIVLATSTTLECVKDIDFDAVVLPGGMPGAKYLSESATLASVLKRHLEKGAFVCAICASPAVVLAPLGILDGKHAVCYPGMEVKGMDFGTERAYRAGNVITSRGPGCSFDFGFEIAKALFTEEIANNVATGMVYRG